MISVYTVTIFMKCMHVCVAKTTYLLTLCSEQITLIIFHFWKEASNLVHMFLRGCSFENFFSRMAAIHYYGNMYSDIKSKTNVLF